MIIAVDFDGTIVDHQFPEIGTIKPHAIETLKAWQKKGHKIILWTCRNDVDPALKGRKLLTEAVEFMAAQGVVFDAVNANLPDLGFNPTPKIYADLYFDDRAYMRRVNWLQFMVVVHYAQTSFNYMQNIIQ